MMFICAFLLSRMCQVRYITIRSGCRGGAHDMERLYMKIIARQQKYIFNSRIKSSKKHGTIMRGVHVYNVLAFTYKQMANVQYTINALVHKTCFGFVPQV